LRERIDLIGESALCRTWKVVGLNLEGNNSFFWLNLPGNSTLNANPT